jgi:hypothetical protein
LGFQGLWKWEIFSNDKWWILWKICRESFA